MPPELHFDPSRLNLGHIEADLEAIRAINPQRYEMEQLSAIVYVDTEQGIIAGYKDVRPDEFWVRGHMPGDPLLPGVIMCEAAAQLASYYIVKYSTLAIGTFIVFGGLEDVRFRAPVRIGDRLVLIAKALKLHRRQSIFNIQGFVGSTMVFHATIIGVPMTSPPMTRPTMVEEV